MSPRSIPPAGLTRPRSPGPLLPVSDRFEAVEAGEGVVLRLRVHAEVDRSKAALILEDATGFDVLRPAADPSDGHLLGFELPARHIGSGARFWLEVGDRVQRLGVPVRIAA